jgi:hypothetical protein
MYNLQATNKLQDGGIHFATCTETWRGGERGHTFLGCGADCFRGPARGSREVWLAWCVSPTSQAQEMVRSVGVIGRVACLERLSERVRE